MDEVRGVGELGAYAENNIWTTFCKMWMVLRHIYSQTFQSLHNHIWSGFHRGCKYISMESLLSLVTFDNASAPWSWKHTHEHPTNLLCGLQKYLLWEPKVLENIGLYESSTLLKMCVIQWDSVGKMYNWHQVVASRTVSHQCKSRGAVHDSPYFLRGPSVWKG